MGIRTFHAVVASVIAACATSVLPAFAQPVTHRIAPHEICGECTIEWRRVARLGSALDENSPFFPGRVSAIGSTFYAAPAFGFTQFLQYDRRGRLTDVIGRSGEGPGEFMIARMVLPVEEDEIAVLDTGLRRITRFDEAGAVAATIRLPFRPESFAPLPNGELLVVSDGRSPDLPGERYHILTADGELRASMGSRAGPVNTRQPIQQIVATTTDGDHFWAASLNSYAIDRWEPASGITLRIAADRPWFRSWETPNRLPADMEPPVTMLTGVWQHGDLLIVSFTTAPEQWRARRRSTSGEREATNISPAEMNQYHDTIIEVIDLSHMRLLKRDRRRGFLLPVWSPNGILLSSWRSESGVDLVDIWEVVINIHAEDTDMDA